MVHTCKQMFRGGSVEDHVDKCLEEVVRFSHEEVVWCTHEDKCLEEVVGCTHEYKCLDLVVWCTHVDKCLEDVVWCTHADTTS